MCTLSLEMHTRSAEYPIVGHTLLALLMVLTSHSQRRPFRDCFAHGENQEAGHGIRAFRETKAFAYRMKPDD